MTLNPKPFNTVYADSTIGTGITYKWFIQKATVPIRDKWFIHKETVQIRDKMLTWLELQLSSSSSKLGSKASN